VQVMNIEYEYFESSTLTGKFIYLKINQERGSLPRYF